MTRNVDEYLALIEEHELRRLLAGGELGQDVELAFAMKVDTLWETMSPQEHQRVEDALEREDVPDGSVLVEIDCETAFGTGRAPRKTA